MDVLKQTVRDTHTHILDETNLEGAHVHSYSWNGKAGLPYSFLL